MGISIRVNESNVNVSGKQVIHYDVKNGRTCFANDTICDEGKQCFKTSERCDTMRICQDGADEHGCGGTGIPGSHTVDDPRPLLNVWETSAIIIVSIVAIVVTLLLIKYCRKRWFRQNDEPEATERYVYRYDPHTGRGSVEVVTETPNGTPTQKREEEEQSTSRHFSNGEITSIGKRNGFVGGAIRSVFDRERISPSLNNLSTCQNRSDLLEDPRPRSSSDSSTRFVYRYNPATGKGSVEQVPANHGRGKQKCKNCSQTTLSQQKGDSPTNSKPKILAAFQTPKHPKTHHMLLQPNGKKGHKYTPTKGRGSVELIPSSVSEGPPRISLSQCDLHSMGEQDSKGAKKSLPLKPKYVYKYNPSTGQGIVEKLPSNSTGSIPPTSRSHGALHTVLENHAPKTSNCRRPAHMGAKYVYKYNPNSGRGSVEIIPKTGETVGGRRRNHHFNYQSSPLASPQGQGPSYSQHTMTSKGQGQQHSPVTHKSVFRAQSQSPQEERGAHSDSEAGISLSISNLLDAVEGSDNECPMTAAPRPRVHTVGSFPSHLKNRTKIQTTVDVHEPYPDGTRYPSRGSLDGQLCRPMNRLPEERRHSSYDQWTNIEDGCLDKGPVIEEQKMSSASPPTYQSIYG